MRMNANDQQMNISVKIDELIWLVNENELKFVVECKNMKR